MQAPYYTFLLDSTYTHAVVIDNILSTNNYTRIAIRYTSYTIDQKLFQIRRFIFTTKTMVFLRTPIYSSKCIPYPHHKYLV